MGRAFEVRKNSMAKTAAAKTKVYSKYGKQLYVAAKSGGPDPDNNLTLRNLIDKAKRDQVPAHVIDKAIEKAKGVGGEDYSASRYEGFGPGGCSVIVDCLTDNANRTITDVRNCFTKSKCKIGAQGSVAHVFEHLAVFSFPGNDGDSVLEDLLNADVDVNDVECEEGKITVFAPATEFDKARQALQDALSEVEFDVAEITYVPINTVEIPTEELETFEKFLSMLEECEDVQDVYHNGVLPA